MSEFKLSSEVTDQIVDIIQVGMMEKKNMTAEMRAVMVEAEDDSLVLSEESNKHLSDVVLTRVGQIINEAWMTGTNVVDHLRMMVLEVDDMNPSKFTLTNEYMGLVETNLRRQAEEAEKLREEIPENIIRGEN